MKRSSMPSKRQGNRRRIDADGQSAQILRGKARSAHMARVAALGCIACMIDGNPGTPAELHHPRSGAGMGRKSPDSDVLPICAAHHRGIDHPRTPSIHLDRLAFLAKFGTESELLARVRALVGDR